MHSLDAREQFLRAAGGFTLLRGLQRFLQLLFMGEERFEFLFDLAEW